MEEDEEATAVTSAKDPVAMPSSTPPTTLNTVLPWVVGARLESKARDTNGEHWFPVKVLEVEAGRVLVHYMNWHSRHDEWIPSNSPRLRPASSTNSGKNSRHNSGKSSRHSSGGNEVEPPVMPATVLQTPPLVTKPANKDFKPGEKVMATWKLNRKYLATIIKFEVNEGHYLVEFYDGVQCKVKPNNMRRPRKGEEDVEQQEALRVNGAADNGSAENSDCEEAVGSTGRRERKRKFDVKTVLNIRSVKSLRSNSKEDLTADSEATVTSTAAPTAPSAASTSSTVTPVSEKKTNDKRKRRPDRTTSEPSINGKSRSKSMDGPALAAVSGKRERRKKKFWDEDENTTVSTTLVTSSVSTSSAVKSKELPSPSMVSSALKRKSSVASVSNPIPKKTAKKLPSEKVSEHGNIANKQSEDTSTAVRPNGVEQSDHSVVESDKSKLDKPSGKENGKVLPYLQLDLGADPELIAEKMIEGVNIPGMGQPIPVDSSSLPEGWEKRVIQRRIGITKGKWDVFITNPETGKSFRSKTELQKHLDERKLPYTSDAFDFSLDDNLKRLRQIWKQYKVKPFLNNPKGTGSTNFKHVPAKITQVQDSDITSRGQHSNISAAASNNGNAFVAETVSNKALPVTPTTAPPPPVTVTTPYHSSSNAVTPAPANLIGNDEAKVDMACLSEIAKESETGQGLRCSIAKCGKLFRNDRLLRQHVKHYHPKVYEGILHRHPQIGDDISEPTSPEAGRRLSDSNDFLHDSYPTIAQYPMAAAMAAESRRRMPSSESISYDKQQPPRRSAKKSLLDEEAPLSSIYEQDMHPHEDSDTFKRTRNDSVLSSVTSDTEDLCIVGDPHFQQHQLQLHQQQQQPQPHQAGHRSNCPPTPPTFRLSKRRQAQMNRKRVQQPVIRVSKIEDTPLGREYRDELLSMATGTGPINSNGLITSSNTTSPTSVNILDSSTGYTPSSYPPSEMDASIAGSEHLTSEELVNCTCRRVEEDGLMIQCDICLCWQHGYCIGLDDEDPVPEKHVCETCRNPAGGRTEAKFSLDQDWLKEGKLPSTDAILDHQITKRKSSSAIFDRETAFRKLSELMADLANLDKVLHCLRVKLHVASQPSNSKVFMWSSVWNVASHQPMSIDDEVEEEEGLEDNDDDDEVETPSMQRCKEMHDQATAAIHRQSAIDPHAVAEKLNLLAANKSHEEATDYKVADTPPLLPVRLPKVNGISRDRSSPTHCSSEVSSADPHHPLVPPQERRETRAEDPSANDHAFRSNNTAEFTSHKDESSVPVTTEVTTSSSSSSPSPPSLPLSSSSPSSALATAIQSLQAKDTTSANRPNAGFETKSKTEEALTNGDAVSDAPLTTAEACELTGNGSKSIKSKIEIDTLEKRSIQNDAPVAVSLAATTDHFDTSFVPSVSELERLLPSVIQEIESVKNTLTPTANPVSSITASTTAASVVTSSPSSHNDSASSIMVGAMVSGSSPRAAVATTSGFIPEPKRLDRDECRLNLLHHIESVQGEIENRYSAIESAISKIEAMPGASNAGFSLTQISDGDAKMKAKLNKLIQDLYVARQLMWTL